MEERDKQLLKMIRKQSEEGMSLLIDEYGGAIKAICSNVLRNYDAGIVQDAMQDVSTDVEREFSRKHNERIVHEVIKEMEEPDRTIFILRFFYYETVKVIAETVHLKEDNVESRIRRGKKKLKAELLRRGVLNE